MTESARADRACDQRARLRRSYRPHRSLRLAAKRLIIGIIAGIAAAAFALGSGASWSVAALCASDIAALWVWVTVPGAGAVATARIARAEDASRAAAEAVLIGAGVTSLVAVAFTLAQARHAHAPARGFLTALAFGSVALAWTSVHTVLRTALLQPARRGD